MNACNEHTLCSHISARLTETGSGFYKMEQVQNLRIVLIGVLYKRSKNDRGLMLFGDEVIVFTVLALGVAGFIFAVSVLWDVTREAR